MINKEKNPSVSGHSEEGTAGLHPNFNGFNSISQLKLNINRDDKFNLAMLKNVKGGNGQYTALCPAHDDRNASLSIKIDNDRVLLHCHAGCSTENIMAALGLPMSALFADDEGKRAVRSKFKPKEKPRQTNTITYEYQYEDGSLAYRKVRYEYSDGSKSFAFFTPDGKRGLAGIRRVPFNLPAVLAADTVYLVEGEKAACAIIASGRTASTLDGGANSKWTTSYKNYYGSRKVIILPDNDAPGLKYGQMIASHLPDAMVILLPELPDKGDICDWLAAGHTMDEIDKLPPYKMEINCPVLLPDEPGFFLPDEPGFISINPFEAKLSKTRYRWDDIGISNLFADCYKNVSRYVPEANSWYVYDGRIWRQDIGGMLVAAQAKKFMYYLLIPCQKHIADDDTRSAWIEFVVRRMRKHARDIMIADAASCWPVSLMAFDKAPYLFNCRNCTLDLRTFAAREHNPDDFLSKVSNVFFDKNADCVRWASFIHEIMQGDGETSRFLQKAMGYALTGDTSEECFFILYGGTTRNGKGTTMETMLNLMGDYGRTAQPETIAQKQTTHGGGPSEDIARLKGARFVNMSEPDKGLRLNSALVKQMTGGDTLTARFLHQNSFEFRPEYKLFINTNHLPRVSDDTVFASGRVKLIPFERHFCENEQDRGLKAFFKKDENVSGIFNWFIEGLRLMQAEGLEQPEAVAAATAQYREESDIIGQFIKENLIKCENNKLKTKDVYTAYEKYCDEYGYRPLNNQNFVIELRKKGYVREKRDRTMGNVIENYMLTGDMPEEF